MSIVLLGSTSGSITLQEPAVAGTTTLTLPTFNGTVGLLVSGTAVASTSGTSIDFTGIPAGVRRITVMFNGVSTNGTSNLQIQVGAGSITTTGYTGGISRIAIVVANSTAFQVGSNNAAANIYSGIVTLALITGNTWAESGNVISNAGDGCAVSGGSIALSGTLDRVRITTVGGTDTFDAGSINILYE